MLALRNADVFYGSAQALHDVTVEAKEGEVVALLGRNGSGKTTTLKAMAGWLPCRKGGLSLGGDVISQPTPELVSRAGVSLVPEDRQVFPRLTVTENLVVATVAHKPGQWSVADVWRMFPRLEERRQARGSDLSGGEQQMLSIARALLCQPKVLLLDEPTEGLAPLTVASLTKSIQHIAESGVAVVLVEQNAKVPRKLANSFYVYDGGRVAWQGTGAELDEQSAIVNALLSF